MLQKHPNFVPKTMNKEHLQAYKGLKECSKVLEEVSQARKDLTEVNYYNLKDASERAKLEDALAKITLESVMNKALVDDYKAQNEVIDEKKAQASVGITMEIQEIQERLKGKENDVERTKQVSVCARKLNDVNSMKLELIRPAKMITDMNSNIKKELLERIKNTEAFKSGIESLCNKQSVRENFLLNNEKLLGQFTSRVVEKHMDIVKDLSAPEKNVVAEAAQASVKKL
jgi:hypothetical protein